MQDVIAADADLVIRRVQDQPGDYALIVAWRNSEHVREWWDPDGPPTLEAVIEELRPSLRGEDPTIPCIIEQAGEPVGFIQFYPWDAETAYLADIGVSVPPGSWGLDLFVDAGLAAKDVHPKRETAGMQLAGHQRLRCRVRSGFERQERRRNDGQGKAQSDDCEQ